MKRWNERAVPDRWLTERWLNRHLAGRGLRILAGRDMVVLLT
jgi:hypothetical protein